MTARLKGAESELSAQQEKNVLVAAEYSDLVKNLEERQREDALQVLFMIQFHLICFS